MKNARIKSLKEQSIQNIFKKSWQAFDRELIKKTKAPYYLGQSIRTINETNKSPIIYCNWDKFF